jgi:hypothetical protein
VLHLIGALCVGVLLMVTGQHVFQMPSGKGSVVRAFLTILLLYGLQLMLGIGSLFVVWAMGERTVPTNGLELLLPTAHVAVGASILALSARLAVLSFAMSSKSRDAYIARSMREALA